MLDGLVLWKMYGRLSGTGRLHGILDRVVYYRVGIETIALDDFQFAMAIHTGQHASFDTISFIIMSY